MGGSAITCDEIIDANEEAKSYDEETKTLPTTFTEKNYNFLYFSNLFISYHCIIDSCYYLLPDKISSKTKTFITISQHK